MNWVDAVIAVVVVGAAFNGRSQGALRQVGAFAGLIAGLITVFTFVFSDSTKDIGYLWHNIIGAVVCVVVGLIVSALTGGNKAAATAENVVVGTGI